MTIWDVFYSSIFWVGFMIATGIFLITLITCYQATARIFHTTKIPELKLDIENLKSELENLTKNLRLDLDNITYTYSETIERTLKDIDSQTDTVKKLTKENEELSNLVIGLRKKIRRLKK